MSWNWLVYALPASSFFEMFEATFSTKYPEDPPSHRFAVVHAIVKSILEAEHLEGSQHFKRIEKMLENLPNSAGPKTIGSLLDYHLRDDFAIKHCSNEELEKGAAFLENAKVVRAADSFLKKLDNRLRLPSVDARIAKIRRAIELRGKEKIA